MKVNYLGKFKSQQNFVTKICFFLSLVSLRKEQGKNAKVMPYPPCDTRSQSDEESSCDVHLQSDEESYEEIPLDDLKQNPHVRICLKEEARNVICTSKLWKHADKLVTEEIKLAAKQKGGKDHQLAVAKRAALFKLIEELSKNPSLESRLGILQCAKKDANLTRQRYARGKFFQVMSLGFFKTKAESIINDMLNQGNFSLCEISKIS